MTGLLQRVLTLLFSTCAEVKGLEPFPSWPGALSFHVSETKLLPANKHIFFSRYKT